MVAFAANLSENWEDKEMPNQEKGLKPEDARALLQSTQQLRVHWSGVITTHIGYAVTLTVAIWGYFLKSYLDNGRPAHILLVAAALSTIVLVLWRLYAHYLDNALAYLYPELLLYESKLGVQPDYGIIAFLTKAVPKLKPILLDKDKLTAEKKVQVVLKLVEKRKIGYRGHLTIDIIVLAFILVTLFAGFMLPGKPAFCSSFLCSLFIALLADIIILLLFYIFRLHFCHRNPSNDDIDEAKATVQ